MSEVVNDIINKGIPVNASMLLYPQDILGLCDDKKKVEGAIKDSGKVILEYLKNKGIECPEISFLQVFRIVQDFDSIVKKICYSEDSIILTLAYNLNINDVPLDKLSQDKERLIEGINELRKISAEKKFQRCFPVLYKAYDDEVQCKKIAQSYRHTLDGYSATWKEKKVAKEALLGVFGSEEAVDDFLKKADVLLSPRIFANKCADLFEFVVKNTDELVDFFYEHPIDLALSSEREKKKFELYVASKYLEYVSLVPEEVKQDYLYYVSNYFLELGNNLDEDISVEVFNLNGEKREIVTQKVLLERYKKVLISNPNLKIVRLDSVDFSTMSPAEVEQFMKGYLEELSANWEMIPKGSLDEAFSKMVKAGTSNMSEEDRKIQQEKLASLYLDKKSLYESSDPYSILRGINTFDGYFAYVYPNGKVILDKYFENVSKGRLARDSAIYVMDFGDFYELSHLSKKELIGHEKCFRIIHAGNWQQRVRDVISSDGATDVSNCYKKLVSDGKISKSE